MNTKPIVCTFRILIMSAILGLVLQGCAHSPTSETRVPRLSKEETKSLLGRPDVIIVDVRATRDWKNAEWKIKGAVREDRTAESTAWMDKYPKDKTLIFYCA